MVFCQCDLLRLNPITTKIAYLLVNRNICGAPDLASSNAKHILGLLKSANDQYQLLDTLPSDQDVIAWIEEAHKLVHESNVVTGTWEIEKSLTHIYQANSSVLNAFHEQKITTNIQLIEKYPGWGELKAFIEKKGLPEGEAKKFYSQADLLRMKSMTPELAYLIAEVDVFGCIGLANKTAASLEKAMREKNATLKILPKDLTIDEVKELVKEAKNYSSHK